MNRIELHKLKEQQLQAIYLLHEHLTRSLPTRKENTISKEKSPLVACNGRVVLLIVWN